MTEPTAPTRSYRGLDADERRAERRGRLLEAALDLYGTRGYAAPRIQELCARAGVTARHFYEAFPAGREGLLLALYAEVVDRHFGAVLAALEGAAPDARPRTGIVASLEAWAADERLARIAFVEVVGVSAEVEARRHETIERYAAFVAGELDRLDGTRDHRWVARALVGATIQAFQSWMAAADRPPLDVLVDELEPLYAAALRSPA